MHERKINQERLIPVQEDKLVKLHACLNKGNSDDDILVDLEKRGTMSANIVLNEIFSEGGENAAMIYEKIKTFTSAWKIVRAYMNSYDEIRFRYDNETNEYAIRVLNDKLPSNTIVIILDDDNDLIHVHANRSIPKALADMMEVHEPTREHFPHYYRVTKRRFVELLLKSLSWEELLTIAFGK